MLATIVLKVKGTKGSYIPVPTCVSVGGFSANKQFSGTNWVSYNSSQF